MENDIRWLQRFDNYKKALNELREAVELFRQRELSKLEKQGVIQAFEYTHELGWKVLKDFLTDKGIMGLIGSKDATREAFKQELIADGDLWKDMIKKRNLTSHTYEQVLAEEVFTAITTQFYAAFVALEQTLDKLNTND